MTRGLCLTAQTLFYEEDYRYRSLDDVRVYGRALSLEEVASLAGRTVPIDRP